MCNYSNKCLNSKIYYSNWVWSCVVKGDSKIDYSIIKIDGSGNVFFFFY